MNKDSSDSNYHPRAMRTRENKTVSKILLAAAGVFLIICGIMYSIFAAPTGSEQKQTLTEITPTGNEPAENNRSIVDEPSGYAEAEPEASAESVQGESANPEVVQSSSRIQENSSDTASTISAKAEKLPTTYIVREGDTLSSISMKFYHSKQHVALLAEQNQLVFINDLKVGDTIKIPALASDTGPTLKKEQDDVDYSKVTLPVTYLVRSGDTLYQLSMLFYHSKDYASLIAEHNKLDESGNLNAGSSLIIPAIPVSNQADDRETKGVSDIEHTVQQGETLSSISRKYYKISYYAKAIAEYNHLADDDDVKIGDVLKIPSLPKS